MTYLKSWMESQFTSPVIRLSIISILSLVRNPSTTSLPPPTTARVAYESQMIIGVQGLLEDRISRLWEPLQQLYYISHRKRRSSSLWAARLAQQLIMLGRYMWDHRNSVKHSDDNVVLQERSLEVNAAIQTQFEMGPEGLPRLIRPMVRNDIRKTLRLPLAKREDWLELVQTERRKARRALAPMRRVMHKFLHPST